MTKILTYVEIDIDYCALTYGTAPCTAAIPTTGPAKCFNTQNTCQDIVNFSNTPLTLRFATDVGYLPDSIDCIPNLVSVNYTPITVSLGEDLGIRANIACTFRDHRHSDTGLDKYLADRAYDPFAQGTFWGKFRARVPYLRGRALRLIRGEVGQALAAMDTRHFIIESFSGPDTNGEYNLTAKDALKYADNDRSVAPRPNTGSTLAAITTASNVLTLNPAGIGDTEYATSGYVAIGGKEVCRYTRETATDANTLLLLHMDGADASTTFTDSSASARTVTVNASAQIDTAQSKFGGASGLFDGVDDYLNLDGSADFAFGLSDFTVDFWIRRTGAGLTQGLYSSVPNASSGIYLDIRIKTTNVIEVLVNAAVVITGTTALSTAAFTHVAVVRASGVTRLYVAGVQEGADYADANVYLNGANRPTIGAGGNSPTTTEFSGWLDEFRVSNVARWHGAFTPYSVSYGTASLSDIMNIVRAQKNTIAVTHNAAARVQKILVYASADPADIIYDLLTTYAGVDAALIPLGSWQAETGAYLQRLYNSFIAEPTGVNTLISELVNQAALSIWWDESSQLIKMQVLRDLSTAAETISEEIYISRSLNIAEQPEKRTSQVWIYYDQLNPLKPLTETENFASVFVEVDLQSESFYGSPAIRRIYSRWIGIGGQSTAERAAEILIARYKDPPRKFSFSLLRGTYDNLTFGSGYNITSWALQEADGSAETVPVQMISINPDLALTTGLAEEIRFAGITLDDPTLHEIVISSDTNNVNLRTIHDSLFSEITGAGITVRCTISEGVKVGSSLTSTPAFDVGSWDFTPTVELIVLGRIQGAGGQGGYIYPVSSYAGKVGGPALYTRYAIDLTVDTGEVWGGGGGGGAYSNQTCGGGGAGKYPGEGGEANPAFPLRFGADGTTEAGGAGSTYAGFVSGNGGGPGLAGSNSADTNAGGAAGAAIDGISFVTVTGGAGDRRGGEIN